MDVDPLKTLWPHDVMMHIDDGNNILDTPSFTEDDDMGIVTIDTSTAPAISNAESSQQGPRRKKSLQRK